MSAEPRSRVFRQVVTLEVLWLVALDDEPPAVIAIEAMAREAIHGADIDGAYVIAGEGSVSDVEELTRP